jgi:hypothetical protein
MSKGAYKYSGGKSMPKSHMPKSSGKMSSAHGVTTKGATKNMQNASNRVGADTRAFKHTLTKKAGKS